MYEFVKTIFPLLLPFRLSFFISSNLVDIFVNGAFNDLSLSVRVRGKARLCLLIEVEHDYLRLVLDFVDAIADFLEEVNVLTCLLECTSNPLVEDI